MESLTLKLRYIFKYKNQFFFGHVFTLVFGGVIYILFRERSLVMFKWISASDSKYDLEEIRIAALSIRDLMPDWFLFSLPDGLWVFSYVSGLMMVWDNRLNRTNYFWIFIIPVLALGSELCQAFDAVPGTFDLMDVAFYLIGAIAPVKLFKPK